MSYVSPAIYSSDSQRASILLNSSLFFICDSPMWHLQIVNIRRLLVSDYVCLGIVARVC